MKKDELSSYLKVSCTGAKNARSACELRSALRMSENELRRNVNRLRREGVPIASDSRGYYYAETAGEIYSTIRNLKKLDSGLNAAISGLEASMNHYGENAGSGDSR